MMAGMVLHIEATDAWSGQLLGFTVSTDDVRVLIRAGLLSAFGAEGNCVLSADVQDLRAVFAALKNGHTGPLVGNTLFESGIPSSLRVGGRVDLDLVHDEKETDPTYFAAARNLLCLAGSEDGPLENAWSTPYFGSNRVTTFSTSTRQLVAQQRRRADLVLASRASQFANSAHYMGSKRLLRGFLVEALSGTMGEDGVVVDLMCGSGAATGAFAHVWPTFASDSLGFCRLLATVQGGGFTSQHADRVIASVMGAAREHAQMLLDRVGRFVEWEDRCFHADYEDGGLAAYRTLTQQFPLFPDDREQAGWNPSAEVVHRKAEPGMAPYCLFTAYFANVYFGIRQAVEVDSLRFAIERNLTGPERDWALGALAVTASCVATTYGGHFAQPSVNRVIDPQRSASRKSIRALLERRTLSVMHEFGVRLRNLALESERTRHPVVTVGGPWDSALDSLAGKLRGERIAVYVDAPYKREEYSRYYHVLETLIQYNYPSSIGEGRTPDKARGERFKSEFFTRTPSQFEQALVRVIRRVLDQKWICAWSFADSGDADITSVLAQATDGIECSVRSVSAPYEHKGHAGRGPKKVTEYVFLLDPQ